MLYSSAVSAVYYLYTCMCVEEQRIVCGARPFFLNDQNGTLFFSDLKVKQTIGLLQTIHRSSIHILSTL